jgi:hypothetical protein
LIAAQLLQGGIGVGGLVAGIGIDQRAFLLEDRFAQQRDDVLALGEPLAAQAPQFLFRLGFVQAQKARTPAIRKAQAVEVVQIPGQVEVGKPRTDTTRRCWSPSMGARPPTSAASASSASIWNGTSGTPTR